MRARLLLRLALVCLVVTAAAASLVTCLPGKAPAFEPSRAGYTAASRAAATQYMDAYWDEGLGYYTSPAATSSLTNIMMVQAFTILAGRNELPRSDVTRTRALLRRLLASPVSAAAGGISFYMDRYAEPHISVSGPFCTALFYAWKAREPLGLSEAERQQLESRVLQEMRWVRGQLFVNLTGSNQTALRWGLEAASAAFRMTGLVECRQFADECLAAFAKYCRSAPDTMYARPWFNPDWTWVYDATLRRQTGPDTSLAGVIRSRAEYGFEYLSHCSAGVFFYQLMAGGFPTENIPSINALLRRSLGEWVVGGYPNWITTQRDHRAFSTNYWAWSLFSLVAMTRWVGWGSQEQGLSRAILDNSVRLFYDMIVETAGAEPSYTLQNPYRVKLYESASLNRHPDLAIAMFAAYVAMAAEVDVFATHPAQEPRVWSWEYVARNLFASTQSYGVASGSDVQSAYYEDRGDISLLFHGCGRLLTPAYVQEADPPPQWAIQVSTTAPTGGTESVFSSDRSAPDSVVVTVDGRVIAPPPYDVASRDPGFGVIEKRSTWTRPGYSVELVLTCLPTHIVRAVTVTPADSCALWCSTYIPNRRELTAVECALTDGRTAALEDVMRSAIPLSGILYIHCLYEGYGYIVMSRTPQLPPGGQVEAFTPSSWVWDDGRGPCLSLTLLRGETVSEPLRVTQVIGFTDGTSQDAALAYKALVGE